MLCDMHNAHTVQAMYKQNTTLGAAQEKMRTRYINACER